VAIEHGVARWLADDPSTPRGGRVASGIESSRAVLRAHGSLVRGSREEDDA
jgi:hypothetical protein